MCWLSLKGALSEDGLLIYLRVLQTFLSQLPASPTGTGRPDSTSDSEDDNEETDQPTSPVSHYTRSILASHLQFYNQGSRQLY